MKSSVGLFNELREQLMRRGLSSAHLHAYGMTLDAIKPGEVAFVPCPVCFVNGSKASIREIWHRQSSKVVGYECADCLEKYYVTSNGVQGPGT